MKLKNCELNKANELNIKKGKIINRKDTLLISKNNLTKFFI